MQIKSILATGISNFNKQGFSRGVASVVCYGLKYRRIVLYMPKLIRRFVFLNSYY